MTASALEREAAALLDEGRGARLIRDYVVTRPRRDASSTWRVTTLNGLEIYLDVREARAFAKGLLAAGEKVSA